MRIGLMVDTIAPYADVIDGIALAARAGFASAWVQEFVGWDPLVVLAAAGVQAPGIELGTSVAALHPRHPLALAAQALTVQAAVGGRLTLGIGASHRSLVESRYGLTWDRPVERVREHLDVLEPVLRGRPAAVRGATVTAVGGLAVDGASAPPILLAAHGPRMLALAGERTDGALTIMVGPELLESYIVPAVRAGAGGRPRRVVAGAYACLTADPGRARAVLAMQVGGASSLPSYRNVLDRQGAAGPQDTMMAGDERTLTDTVRRYAEAGATDLVVYPTGTPRQQARTIDFFGGISRDLAG